MWKVTENRTILFAIVLVLYLAIAGTATATTIYVDDNGHGKYKTIQAAVNNANQGDKIIVKPGTYKENIDVTVSDLTIVSESENPADTIIQAANNPYVFWIWGSGINIKGFSIKGSSDSDGSDGVYLHYSTGNCHIENNEFSNLSYGIDIFILSMGNVISNDTISNCWQGISLSEGSYNTLSNNTISNCSDGISLGSGSNGNNLSNNTISNCSNGISLSDCVSNLVESNLITENNNGIFLTELYHSTLTKNTLNSNKESGLKISGWYPEDSTSGIQIYNNYFSNEVNVDFEDQPVIWNSTRAKGINIIGGPYIGGNYWATPLGDGFSQTHSDANGDCIAEEPYYLDGVNVDYLPLVVPFEDPESALPIVNSKTNITQGY